MMENLELNTSFESFIDQDEVNTKIISHLNSIFGKDVKNLSKVKDLVQELTATQNELKGRLLFATSEAPDKITKAVKEAEDALSKSAELETQFTNISTQLSDFDNKHKDLIDAISPDIKEYEYFKKVEVYQKWIANTEELSNQIKFHLKSNNEEEVMHCYDRLKESTKVILDSKCDHLTEYCSKMLAYWYHTLRNKIESDVEKELKLLKWPFTSSNFTIKTSSKIPVKATEKLERLLGHLLQLEIPSQVLERIGEEKDIEAETNQKVPTLLQDFSVSLFPIQLLLKPIEVRFQFHFSGSKATNSRQNPEWYLTQVLKWIGAHQAFIECRIQPVLTKNNIVAITAMGEFMKGLVRLVTMKLLTDLPEIESDEDIFCKTIQGTLNFERELRYVHNYPRSLPSVLGVLTQPAVFTSWISIERKFALELMDEFVSSSNAWKSEDENELGVCHCGEQLILLLQGIADRYKPLPQPGHRMQFLELQLELLDDFRVRVLQIMKSELSDPLESNYCSILNTVNHIQVTLADWADLPFYIEMQYYHEQFTKVHREMKSAQLFKNDNFLDCVSAESEAADDNTMLDSFVSAVALNESVLREDAFVSLNRHSKPTSSCLKINGSVFDEISELYSRIECEMLTVVTEHVMTEIRARSQAYRKDKWFVTPTVNVTAASSVLEISPSLCALLQVLVKHLNLLKDKLNSVLFTVFWKSIASLLNKYIYEEVILQNKFSDYGATQLKHDMIKAIFPIFGEYHTKPDSFFPHIKDCLILLTLPRPTALLLKETLKSSTDKEFLMTSPVKALEESSVLTLTVHEADIILTIRTNMANS